MKRKPRGTRTPPSSKAPPNAFTGKSLAIRPVAPPGVAGTRPAATPAWLAPDRASPTPTPPTGPSSTRVEKPGPLHDGTVVRAIPLDRIEPDPTQPRVALDPEALQRLAESFVTHGQLQPITVRPGPAPGWYVIVTGERRWRAASLAGQQTVAAIVLDGSPGRARLLEMQLIENAQREDLPPLDQARAFRLLMERQHWSASHLAETLHLSPSTVVRALRLLDLPDRVRAEVESGRIAPSVAYEIAKLDDPGRQGALAARVVTERLSRSQTQAAMRTPPGEETRHLFDTTTGRLTVILNRPAGPDDLITALSDAIEILQGKHK